MYELKTLLPQFEIQLPTCMYTLRNVSLSADATSNGINDAGQVPAACVHSNSNVIKCSTSSRNQSATSKCALDLDVLGRKIQQLLKSDNAAIAARQHKVLQQLNELREQLTGIRSTLGLCQKGPQHTKQNSMALNGGLREEPLHDIVINGHPNFIPYALLALKNAWKDLFTIDVSTFTHSTMRDIGAEAREFEKQLQNVPTDPGKPKVKVTLIWKNCEHTEMISSPTMYVPIYGEVNIIRYLARVGPNEYRYENSPLCNETDAVLDICYQLLRCITAKDRATMIRALNNRLQKQQYFGGTEMSVADIGVHSSLRRMPAIRENELTPALNEWRKRAQLVTLI